MTRKCTQCLCHSRVEVRRHDLNQLTIDVNHVDETRGSQCWQGESGELVQRRNVVTGRGKHRASRGEKRKPLTRSMTVGNILSRLPRAHYRGNRLEPEQHLFETSEWSAGDSDG